MPLLDNLQFKLSVGSRVSCQWCWLVNGFNFLVL